MEDTTCTTALSDLIEIAEQDSRRQMQSGQRIRPDKFTAGKYAKIIEKAFPGDVKASHFRTARTNAKRIRAGESEYVTIPCFTLRAFITYLFTVEGDKDWTGVRSYINNNLEELRSLLSAEEKQGSVLPIKGYVAQPIEKWEPKEGQLGDHILRVGHYVKQLETKSKTTIQQLMKDHQEVKNQRESDKREYSSLLSEMQDVLLEMQSLSGTGTPEAELQLQNSINELKQKIESYKKS